MAVALSSQLYSSWGNHFGSLRISSPLETKLRISYHFSDNKFHLHFGIPATQHQISILPISFDLISSMPACCVINFEDARQAQQKFPCSMCAIEKFYEGWNWSLWHLILTETSSRWLKATVAVIDGLIEFSLFTRSMTDNRGRRTKREDSLPLSSLLAPLSITFLGGRSKLAFTFVCGAQPGGETPLQGR